MAVFWERWGLDEYDIWDIPWDDLEEIYSRYIAEFTTERLRSFYAKNPMIAEAPFRALYEARDLFAQRRYSAALVFAFIATEVGIRVTLFKPVVCGVVHDDSTAELIASLVVRQPMDRFRNLLFQILAEYGNVDLRTFTRSGSHRVLWKEIGDLRALRNRVVHRAETASEAEAEEAISIASCILEDIFPAVVRRVGLDLQNGNRICPE